MAKLAGAFENFRGQFEPDRPVIQGWMIDHESRGDARVGSDLSKVYVLVDRGEGFSSGDVIKAKCDIRPVPGWPVKVGTTRERYWEYSVLEVDEDALGEAIKGVSKLGYHAETHEWGHPSGSDDPVYSRFQQLYDFGVWPGSLLNVFANSGVFDPSGTKQEFGRTTLDLTGVKPGSNERYVTVVLTPSGTLEYVPGTVKSTVTLADIPPAVNDDHWELAAVRLRHDTTQIVHTPGNPNIVDLRFAKLGWYAQKGYVGDQIEEHDDDPLAHSGTGAVPEFFTDLADTPADYVGQGGLYPRVRADELGLEFAAGGSGPTGTHTFLGLYDTPSSYAGQAGRAPVVNAIENALEFVDVATQSELDTHEGAVDPHAVYLLATGTRAGASGQAQGFGANGITADVISESTADAGVTIETVLIEDGLVDGVDVSAHASRHGDGGADSLIDIGTTEPGSPFAGMVWIKTI